ncbi:MAG: YitT family protein [Flavobacteriales bacterium]
MARILSASDLKKVGIYLIGNRSEYEHIFKDSLWILLGIACAAIGLEGFIVPNGLLDGGVTGVSLILAKLTPLNVPFYIFILNLPFIFLGFRQVSKIFAVKTFVAIIVLSVLLLVLQTMHVPRITDDKLLIAVFGGFFLGAGIGFAMRGGCVIDGTEVLALYMTRKLSMQVGEIILLINVLIFLIAASLFGIEMALYSILTYMAASKTVDYITNGIEEYTGVIIISSEHEKIRKEIISQLGRGVTIYNGKRGLRGKKALESGLNDRDILFTVVTKLELTRLRNIVDEIDDSCFMTTHAMTGVKGGMIKQRKLH